MFRKILDRVGFEHQVGTYLYENDPSTPPRNGFQSSFEQNTNQEFSEVHYFVQLNQYFLNFAKRLKMPDTKGFFDKVPVILAQFKKVVNLKKFLICVLFKS